MAAREPFLDALDRSCRGIDPNFFFPKDTELRKIKAAKAICRGCFYRIQCYDYAIATKQDGIWGGSTWEERQIGQFLRGLVEPAPESQNPVPTQSSPDDLSGTQHRTPLYLVQNSNQDTERSAIFVLNLSPPTKSPEPFVLRLQG
jgi:WhiB family transcriptional regulator, redox-sensing transcriptional regulator